MYAFQGSNSVLLLRFVGRVKHRSEVRRSIKRRKHYAVALLDHTVVVHLADDIWSNVLCNFSILLSFFLKRDCL